MEATLIFFLTWESSESDSTAGEDLSIALLWSNRGLLSLTLLLVARLLKIVGTKYDQLAARLN